MKKYLSVLLALVMLICLTACGSNAPAGTPAPETTSAPETQTAETASPPETEAPAASITVTDLLGNEVTLEAPARHIVGTHSPTMNLAIVLGGGGKYILGYGGNKGGTLNSYVCPELQDTAALIGKGKDINFETVASLNADLCILPQRYKNLAADFENVGLPVAIVLSSSESFEAVRTSLKLLGTLLGEDARAEAIAAAIEGIEAKVMSATAAVPEEEKPSVMFLGASKMYSVATDSMIQTEIMEKAGAKNAVTGLTVYGDFAEVSAEEIVGWNPQIIWIPNYASYTVEDVLNDDAFRGTEAVKNGRVYVFPSALEPWDYPTAACVLGLAWAARELHSDLYSEADLIDACDTLYGLIYGRTFTMEEMGLAG